MTQVPDTGPQAVASKVLNGLHGVDGPKVLHIVQHSLTLCRPIFCTSPSPRSSQGKIL